MAATAKAAINAKPVSAIVEPAVAASATRLRWDRHVVIDWTPNFPVVKLRNKQSKISWAHYLLIA